MFYQNKMQMLHCILLLFSLIIDNSDIPIANLLTSYMMMMMAMNMILVFKFIYVPSVDIIAINFCLLVTTSLCQFSYLMTTT